MRSTLLLLILAGSLPACATIREVAAPVIGEVPSATRAEREAERLQREADRLRAELPRHPADTPPAERAALKTWESAVKDKAVRIVVSREARALWYMRDTTVLFSAPIAVGKQEPFTYAGKRYDFTTPVGKRRVISKDSIPIWVPPDWHYFEIAVDQELTPVQLHAKQRRHALSDSTVIELRGKQVGRINQFGNFWPFTPGNEIIFDGKLFIPPVDSEQRRVPAVLGTRKLALGDGYLIHGTNVESSIGAAVSHGCVRMYNEDVEHLYDTVPVGTAVYIF